MNKYPASSSHFSSTHAGSAFLDLLSYIFFHFIPSPSPHHLLNIIPCCWQGARQNLALHPPLLPHDQDVIFNSNSNASVVSKPVFTAVRDRKIKLRIFLLHIYTWICTSHQKGNLPHLSSSGMYRPGSIVMTCPGTNTLEWLIDAVSWVSIPSQWPTLCQ